MIPNTTVAASTIPLAVGTKTPTALPPKRPPKRPTVLLVGHPDGWVELFSDERLDARFVMLADAEGVDGELLAEDWASLRLPRRHRDIYLPGRLQLADQIRPERPSDIARRDTLVAMHQALSRLEGDR